MVAQHLGAGNTEKQVRLASRRDARTRRLGKAFSIVPLGRRRLAHHSDPAMKSPGYYQTHLSRRSQRVCLRLVCNNAAVAPGHEQSPLRGSNPFIRSDCPPQLSANGRRPLTRSTDGAASPGGSQSTGTASATPPVKAKERVCMKTRGICARTATRYHTIAQGKRSAALGPQSPIVSMP
jgi:hypothetical protein